MLSLPLPLPLLLLLSPLLAVLLLRKYSRQIKDLPKLTVYTQWSGASPKAVQRSITLPIEESVRKAPMDSIVHYNAACLYALAGDPEKSIDCLENCRFRVGNLNREWLMHDSDLDSVRGHPRFAEILNSFAD